MGFIGLILKNWQLVTIGLLSAALAGSGVYVKILKSDIATVQAKVDTLKGELGVSQASVKTLQQAVTEQNDAVGKLKLASDVRFAANQVELKKAKASANAYKKRAQEIMISKVPDNIPRCDAASSLIDQEIKNGK